jgi:hypothetical protein
MFATSVRMRHDPGALHNRHPDLADLLLYPFATPELLVRYARLNGALMRTDVLPLLALVVQPALIVSSEDDQTTHPEGSRVVAAGLRRGRLHLEPHGDHVSIFNPAAAMIELAEQFMTDHDRGE